MAFQLNQDIHGVKVNTVKEDAYVTKAALGSLRLALKAYFNTYYAAHRKQIIDDLSISPSHAFYETSIENIDRFCENIEYQELYMQTIFHFHHFFELLLKDILKSVHSLLDLKLSLEGSDSLKILDIIQNKKGVSISHENTVEFSNALDRVCNLIDKEDGVIPIVVKTIKENKSTLSDLNLLRNRVWHKGIFVLRLTELDQFISQNILPLVLQVIQRTDYNNLEQYWKYANADLDPIKEIIKAGRNPINYKRIAFFKTYGIACYNNSKSKENLSLVLNETLDKAKAIVKSLHDVELETCYVCKQKTLIVSTISDHEVDTDGTYLGAWWTTTAAECLNCRLSVYPDVGEPGRYGASRSKLWKSGDYGGIE